MRNIVIEWGFVVACVALSGVAMRIVFWRARRIWFPSVLAIGAAYVVINLVAYFLGNGVSDLYTGWFGTVLVLVVTIPIVRKYKVRRSGGSRAVTKR